VIGCVVSPQLIVIARLDPVATTVALATSGGWGEPLTASFWAICHDAPQMSQTTPSVSGVGHAVPSA
jgi:hypothetical protein